ncbi:MAG: hypothetical protein IT165_30955 [Bryobacterales bacterium]|nr:hypothetical protein [Bryobacterales bacterium]
MRPIGFSTGALARGDYRTALALLRRHQIRFVELSALRLEELPSLIRDLPFLDLEGFSFVSVHAPSRFPPDLEPDVAEQLRRVAEQGYPVVVHPDVIQDFVLWKAFGKGLLIENMDKRKPVGRTVEELNGIFRSLPLARFCFDIGHARQVDPSMTEAVLLLKAFGDRLAEVHMSEVNTSSRHDPISRNAVNAFRAVADFIPENIPIILEPLIDKGQSSIDVELARAQDVFALAAA